jgi:hypothetical protein
MGVLAQLDPGPVADGLAKNPLAWGLALALGAIVYLYRALEVERREHRETIRGDAKDQLALLERLVPLATKLTEALVIVEHLTKRD